MRSKAVAVIGPGAGSNPEGKLSNVVILHDHQRSYLTFEPCTLVFVPKTDASI